jgi:hypothetical protein
VGWEVSDKPPAKVIVFPKGIGHPWVFSNRDGGWVQRATPRKAGEPWCGVVIGVLDAEKCGA